MLCSYLIECFHSKFVFTLPFQIVIVITNVPGLLQILRIYLFFLPLLVHLLYHCWYTYCTVAGTYVNYVINIIPFGLYLYIDISTSNIIYIIVLFRSMQYEHWYYIILVLHYYGIFKV